MRETKRRRLEKNSDTFHKRGTPCKFRAVSEVSNLFKGLNPFRGVSRRMRRIHGNFRENFRGLKGFQMVSRVSKGFLGHCISDSGQFWYPLTLDQILECLKFIEALLKPLEIPRNTVKPLSNILKIP